MKNTWNYFAVAFHLSENGFEQKANKIFNLWSELYVVLEEHPRKWIKLVEQERTETYSTEKQRSWCNLFVLIRHFRKQMTLVDRNEFMIRSLSTPKFDAVSCWNQQNALVKEENWLRKTNFSVRIDRSICVRMRFLKTFMFQ